MAGAHEWDTGTLPRAVKFCTHPAARHRLVTHEKTIVVRVRTEAGRHPNVVPLVECNLDGETPWLMYEYVPGGTLADAARAWSALDRAERALAVLRQLAGALAHVHRLDPPIVHRDLKPANVLMAGDVPRITDFGIGGIAAPPAGGAGADAAVPAMLRAAGSRRYASPEQMRGEPPSPRDDVYALGVIAYQLLVGDLHAAPGPDAERELLDAGAPGELAGLVGRSVGRARAPAPRTAASGRRDWPPCCRGRPRTAGRSPCPATGTPDRPATRRPAGVMSPGRRRR